MGMMLLDHPWWAGMEKRASVRPLINIGHNGFVLAGQALDITSFAERKERPLQGTDGPKCRDM